MKIDLEKLKELVEAGNVSDIEEHIKKDALEKSDMTSITANNAGVLAYIDSEKDKHSKKALQTWQDKNLQGLIDAAVKEATNDEQTPEQKRIAALEQKLAETEVAALRDKLTAAYTKQAAKDNVPAELLDFVIGPDEDSTKANYEKLASTHKASVQAAIESEFKGTGRKPGSGEKGDGNGPSDLSFGAKLAGGQTIASSAKSANDYYFGK